MGIIYDLWEVPKKPQQKIQGVGYSSVYLSSNDKAQLSYKIWKQMISKCYSHAESMRETQDGHFVECCNSWLDYQNFLKWFYKNYNECTHKCMVLTRCIISRDNLIYNPNNCAIVPSKVDKFFKAENRDFDTAKKLAEKYKDCICDDVYEQLTEEEFYE